MTNAVATTEAERAVRAAIDQWLKGTMTADADALDRVLAPDYTYTHASSAAVDSREVWLELNTAFQSVWVPIDGEWKVVAWQATRLAKPEA